MSIKVSCSMPDQLAIDAAETYYAARGEEFGMSELVQVAFATLINANDKALAEARETVVSNRVDGGIVLPGLKAKKTKEGGE